MPMNDTLKALWDAVGERVCADPRTSEKRMRMVFDRIAPALFANADVALGLPIYRDVEFNTVKALVDLVYVGGLQPLLYQNFEISCSREWIVQQAINLGFRRLLFLDSDTVVDMAGFTHLMETMDRTGAAMAAALVRRRFEPGAKPTTNAFVGTVGDMAALDDADIPSTLAPFPVHYVGLAAALLDLEQISKHEGPRFARRSEGLDQMSENWLFCRWLESKDLTFVVDPAVSTMHEIVTSHRYDPPKAP